MNTMQANLTHYYEDLTQLEDDILSFLPTVSDIDVFGCEVDLIELDTLVRSLPHAANYSSALRDSPHPKKLLQGTWESCHSTK